MQKSYRNPLGAALMIICLLTIPTGAISYAAMAAASVAFVDLKPWKEVKQTKWKFAYLAYIIIMLVIFYRVLSPTISESFIGVLFKHTMSQ